MQFPHPTTVRRSFTRFAAVVFCAASPLFPLLAADPPSPEELANLTVEQLLNVTVTSTKRDYRLLYSAEPATNIAIQRDFLDFLRSGRIDVGG